MAAVAGVMAVVTSLNGPSFLQCSYFVHVLAPHGNPSFLLFLLTSLGTSGPMYHSCLFLLLPGLAIAAIATTATNPATTTTTNKTTAPQLHPRRRLPRTPGAQPPPPPPAPDYYDGDHDDTSGDNEQNDGNDDCDSNTTTATATLVAPILLLPLVSISRVMLVPHFSCVFSDGNRNDNSATLVDHLAGESSEVL